MVLYRRVGTPRTMSEEWSRSILSSIRSSYFEYFFHPHDADMKYSESEYLHQEASEIVNG